MTESGVSTTDLSRALGISYQAVRKVLLGGQFGTENNVAAAKRLGVNSDWLATGKGARKSAGTGEAPPLDSSALSERYAQVLQDLEDIPPGRRQRLVDTIQQAAEEAREAAAHFALRDEDQRHIEDVERAMQKRSVPGSRKRSA